eukprot:6491536-Amphidinium_carterae.1
MRTTVHKGGCVAPAWMLLLLQNAAVVFTRHVGSSNDVVVLLVTVGTTMFWNSDQASAEHWGAKSPRFDH